MRKLTPFVVLLVSLDSFIAVLRAQPAPPPAGQAPAAAAPASAQWIFLADCSDSIGALDPPDRMHVCVQHCIDLALLSKQPVKVAVIFFGGDRVTVFGDEKGMPTTALTDLSRRLLKEWPDPAGATPMDQAFEEAARILRQSTGTQATIVLMSDGQPESGRLRPQDFPQVADLIEKRRKEIDRKYKGHPPKIIQYYLKKLEAELEDPSTDEFKRLYEEQLKLEYAKTLKHAETFKHSRARFITLDFVGLSQLHAIHQAAGGIADDLVVATPNGVIARLHALRLAALPRVVRQPPLALKSDTNAFERTTEVPVDEVAEAAVVTVELHRAIEHFDKHVRMEADIDGQTRQFALTNDDPNVVLAKDAKGNVATATVILDRRPTSGKVTIRFQSPTASVHVPAATVYVHFRLHDDLKTEFRPTFLEPEATPPYRVSSHHAAAWQCALRSGKDHTPHPVKLGEAVLRHQLNGRELPMALHIDSRTPGLFLSDRTQIPVGHWDVRLHLELPSGARITITLIDQVMVVSQPEIVTVEFPVSTNKEVSEGMSFDRRHLDFGDIGDDVTTWTIFVTLRSLNLKYPVAISPSIEIADPDQDVPQQPWFNFGQREVVLPPGQAVKLRIRLTLPDRIEESIDDGPFEGWLRLAHQDTGQSLEIKRFVTLSGVNDDDPVDRVTFRLRRPRTIVAIPRCFRNWVETKLDGELHTTIHVAIGHRFCRLLVLQVRHDSEVPRSVTALASGQYLDRAGRQVPSVRLVALEGSDSMQEIPPGETGEWRFMFEMDDDCRIDRAFGALDITGDGLRPVHLRVGVVRRDPQLSAMIERVLAVLAAVIVLLLLASIVRYLRVRVRQSDSERVVTPRRGFAGMFSLKEAHGGQVQIVAQDRMRVRAHGDRHWQILAPGQSRAFDPSSVTPVHPFEIEQDDDDGSDPIRVEIGECLTADGEEPELTARVVNGGRYDDDSAVERQRIGRQLLAVSLCVGLMLTLNWPTVVGAAQWTYDLIHMS